MQITREISVDIKKTVENSVAGNEEFHFFVDELTSNGCMPTYAGMADEKYSFDEMDEGFFEFLSKKASEDGIFIRLVFANHEDGSESQAVFNLEYGGKSEVFVTDELDRIFEFEFADYGIMVKKDKVTFGATVEGGCGRTPHFGEFGSSKAEGEFLSVENPLNRHVVSIMEGMIVRDE